MDKKIFLVFFALIVISAGAFADEAGDKRSKAGDIADEIVNMRSNLAKTFIKPEAEITEETFKKVCGAVGKKVKEITEREGVKIRHAATKNRNPMNSATSEETEVLAKFNKDRNLKEISGAIEREGKKYYSFEKPIFVEEACLACHGQKDKRPKFIVDKYPDDKAYGFKVGDLRGMISIMIPLSGEQK